MDIFFKMCADMRIEPVWGIEKVIFNNPATVIYWNDGTRTVVKCQPEDTFDREKGFLLACCKKMFGNTGRYNNILAEYVPEESNKNGINIEQMRQALANSRFMCKCPCDYGICDECNQLDEGNSQELYKSARGYFDRYYKKEGNNE